MHIVHELAHYKCSWKYITMITWLVPSSFVSDEDGAADWLLPSSCFVSDEDGVGEELLADAIPQLLCNTKCH